MPVVLGGIEASLRRIAHYDYWSDSVRRSIVLDSKCDLLVFGMGERAAWEIARRLDAGEQVREIRTCAAPRTSTGTPRDWEPHRREASRYVTDGGVVVLPVVRGRSAGQGGLRQDGAHVPVRDERPQRPPAPPGRTAARRSTSTRPRCRSTEDDMDGLYDLPFARLPHPSYGGERIPAYETVKHSIVTMRGCFGGCTFCSITEHEGRIIQSRSEGASCARCGRSRAWRASRASITDVGGPTANMYQMRCKDERTESACRRLSCVHPGICENLVTDHAPLVSLLKKVRKEPGIKRVFVASGVRYDLAMRSPEFMPSSRSTTPAGSSPSRPSTTTRTCSTR